MDSTNTATKALTLIAAAMALTGCLGGSKRNFTCPVPGGVKCMASTEVYERTNHVDSLNDVLQDSPSNRRAAAPVVQATVSAPVAHATAPAAAVAPVQHAAPVYAQAEARGASLSVVAPSSYQQQPYVAATLATPRAAEPHRDPAQVLKVWVSPFEDEAGRLHMPSKVFVEIEPRRWNVGHRAASASTRFALIETPGQGAAQDGQNSADASALPRRQGMANQPSTQ